jgi:FlaA1/EpsC-like NDP-sugar epimerase
LQYNIVPSLTQYAKPPFQHERLNAARIEDFAAPKSSTMMSNTCELSLCGKVILVTGAGGNVGQELCRQIASFKPARLLMVERSEAQLSAIQRELIRLGRQRIILPILADVLDSNRLRRVFEQWRPALIFHAAAYKQAEMVENQPDEAIKSNVLGVARLAELAQEFRVDRFLLVSSNKAACPISLMGATKRLAEFTLRIMQASRPESVKMMAVRFGNVHGSADVLFTNIKNQIAAGGPVTLAHRDAVRLFFALSEAVKLLLHSAFLGQGGEVFALAIGRPLRVLEITQQLIHLSGLQPNQDMPIVFEGLPPGEPLIEEMPYAKEQYAMVDSPQILRLNLPCLVDRQIREILPQLDAELLKPTEPNRLKWLMKQAVPEYEPVLSSDKESSFTIDTARENLNLTPCA